MKSLPFVFFLVSAKRSDDGCGQSLATPKTKRVSELESVASQSRGRSNISGDRKVNNLRTMVSHDSWLLVSPICEVTD